MVLLPVLLAAIFAIFYRQAMAGKIVSTVVRAGDISYYMHPLTLSVRPTVLYKLKLLLTTYRILNMTHRHSILIRLLERAPCLRLTVNFPP